MISVIMANYNTKISYLESAINSILNQSYKNIELIIVDDCSTDESYNYLLQMQKKNNNIRVIRNEKNRGLAYSLNRAIKESKGEYIARMDSDDISCSKRLMKQIHFLEKHNNVHVVGTAAETFGDSDDFSFSSFHSCNDIKCQLLFSTVLVHPSIIFRRDVFKEEEMYYNEDFKCSQDYELWTRIVKKFNIAVINEPLLKYRIHNEQISVAKRELQKKYAIEICNRELKYLEINEFNKYVKQHLILCRKEEFEVGDYKKIIEWIKILLLSNKEKKIYDDKCLKKNIYNRFFNVVLKSNIPKIDKIGIIMKNPNLLSVSNIYSIIYRIVYKTYWSIGRCFIK